MVPFILVFRTRTRANANANANAECDCECDVRACVRGGGERRLIGGGFRDFAADGRAAQEVGLVYVCKNKRREWPSLAADFHRFSCSLNTSATARSVRVVV